MAPEPDEFADGMSDALLSGIASDTGTAPVKREDPFDALARLGTSARRDIRPTLSKPAPATTTAGALQTFMQGNSQMLETQRRNIQAAESKFEFERTQLIDSYRVKLEDLEHEAAQALLAFDTMHEAELTESRKLLALLAEVQKQGGSIRG